MYVSEKFTSTHPLDGASASTATVKGEFAGAVCHWRRVSSAVWSEPPMMIVPLPQSMVAGFAASIA